MIYCTDCFQKGSLDEVGYDVWEGGEECQYICNCDNGAMIRSVVLNWENFEVEYYGIYTKVKSMESENEIS